MTEGGSRTGSPGELHDPADVAKIKAVVRRTIGQSLGAHFPPAEDLPPKLRELIERLGKV
jgi:hypothetical protein